MTLTAGALTLVSVAATTASLSSAAATSGTSPYTYQWYRSTTTGFTPGAGNLISGATALTLSDTGLVPNTTYYYKVVATDSAGTPATATSSQLAVVTTGAVLQPNQFDQALVAGFVDQKLSLGTYSCQVDSSQTTALLPGQAVKIVDNAGGVPKVAACAANSDNVFGFISATGMKDQSYAAGQAVEVAGAGNTVYLYATSAVARGAQVQLDYLSTAAVTALVGSSGAANIGYAYDKAAAAGALIRVKIMETAMFTKA